MRMYIVVVVERSYLLRKKHTVMNVVQAVLQDGTTVMRVEVN